MPWQPGKKASYFPSTATACTHKEHQILTTADAASFAIQFWVRKAHPTKASQQELLATCIAVKPLPLWKGATMRPIRIQNNQCSLKHCFVLRIDQVAAVR